MSISERERGQREGKMVGKEEEGEEGREEKGREERKNVHRI